MQRAVPLGPVGSQGDAEGTYRVLRILKIFSPQGIYKRDENMKIQNNEEAFY